MVVLVTYLPFYRVHEVAEYFMRNVEVVKPRAAVVYVDNVYREGQREILAKVLPSDVEVRVGNWRNRNNTWLTMLRDFHAFNDDIMVVDSDNIVEPVLVEVHGQLRSRGLYTILDREAWDRGPRHFLIRSRRVGDLKLSNTALPLYEYRVYDDSLGGMFRGGSVFFIGPKQVVSFSRLPDIELLSRVERALGRVDPWLRNYISDETLLGIIAHLMGFEWVPWTIASHHHHHGSTPGKATKLLVAAAHYQLGRGLVREFGGWGFRRYTLKYLLSSLKNIRSIF
ncbi:hypothetical protein [Vulcanisaeta thermophila]|uniref:hypothetical protein n=1 Tax=Vulcanisaeta thermophila TaxID=867917 RepID=UPI000853C585|nr:hypothetical protein [Vulcanisaeta thermophila]